MKTIPLFILLTFVTSQTYAVNDPTRPPHYKNTNSVQTDTIIDADIEITDTTTVSGFKLSMISVNRHHASAIINGETVSVGDSINQARVTHISSDEVSLDVNGETTQLLLGGADIKSYVNKNYIKKR